MSWKEPPSGKTICIWRSLHTITGHQASAKMSPFEILYGRKCTTHVSWDSPMDRLMVGPKMLQYMEQTVQELQII